MATSVVKLSDSAINRCLKDRSITEIRDRHSKLRLRVNSSWTGGSWYVVLRKNGKDKWQNLGKYPDLPVKVIEKRLPDILARYAANDEVTTDHWSTLSGLLVWYRDRLKADRGMSDKRKASVLSAIKCHLLPKLGSLRIRELNRSTLDSLLFWPLQADYSVSFIHQIWGILKTAVRRAHKLKYLEVDLLSGLKVSDSIAAKPKPKGASIRPDYASELIEVLEGHDWPERVIVSLMLLHGTRIGETRKAKWDDFDLINDYWHLPVENIKTEEPLRLPVTPTVKELLCAYQEYQKGIGKYGVYLFPGTRSKEWSDSKAGKIIRKVSCGEWRSHDLRKVARTQWADLGIDYHIAERLLNHKMSKLDQTYIHTSTETAKREALEKYHEWLIGQGFKSVINQDRAKMEGVV